MKNIPNLLDMKTKKTSTLSKNILERLELNKSFALSVRKARIESGIPLNGFKSDDDYLAWIMGSRDRLSKQNEPIPDLVCEGLKILEITTGSFIDSPIILYLIRSYFLFGKDNNMAKGSLAYSKRRHLLEYPSISLYSIKNFKSDDYVNIKEDNPNGAIIELHPRLTRDELIKFTKKHYKDMRIVMHSTKRPPRLRKYAEIEKHKKIFNLWQKYYRKSVKELRIISDNSFLFSKYEAISFLLKRNHDIDIKADALRTLVSRMKKREGIHNT